MSRRFVTGWILPWEIVVVAGIGLATGIARGDESDVARAGDTADLRARQEAQQRARDLAQELVSRILAIQKRQLVENGLEGLQIYRDIDSMETNISGLVEAEMLEVVDLLANAQSTDDEDMRREAFVEARRLIREIVVRLSLERQNLLRRLKSAELAAQVKRLIGLQTLVRDVTESISARPRHEQEKVVLAAIQDQHDARTLFVRLVESLVDVGGWGGPISAGAADGLRILDAADVGESIDLAGAKLESSEPSSAAVDQHAVLRGLALLLRKLEETQGLIVTDREAALEIVRELMRRQEEIRDRTQEADLGDMTETEQLIDAESALRRDLGQLQPALATSPSLLPLVDEARGAAYEASGRLFEMERDQAIEHQDRVLAILEEIEARLRAPGGGEPAAQSSEQLRQRVAALDAALDAARDEVAADRASGSSDPRLEAAASEADAALADARREQQAVEIGEIARAAEAVERAAAAEREIARQSADAPLAGVGRDVASALSREHELVEAVASRTREAVAVSAPRAAAELDVAAPLLDAIGAQLDLAAGAKAASTPAAAGDAARGAVRELARDASLAAARLESAAVELRRELGESAERLRTMTGEQLAAVQRARRELDDAAPGLESAPRVATLRAREGRLSRDHAVAAAISEFAGAQRRAADAILAGRDAFADAESSGAPSGAPSPAAGLAGAAREFASARAATGQGVEAISGQREIVHPPLRDALEHASQLGAGIPLSETGGAPVGRPSGASQAMGSGFVPASPETTARMMAGALASAQLDALAAAGHDARDASGAAASPSPGPPSGSGDGSGSSVAAAGNASAAAPAAGSRDGSFALERGPGEGPLVLAPGARPAGGRNGTAGARELDLVAPPAGSEPWFARLPPELRRAIRSGATRRPPRGYEERLRRYFESVD